MGGCTVTSFPKASSWHTALLEIGPTPYRLSRNPCPRPQLLPERSLRTSLKTHEPTSHETKPGPLLWTGVVDVEKKHSPRTLNCLWRSPVGTLSGAFLGSALSNSGRSSIRRNCSADQADKPIALAEAGTVSILKLAWHPELCGILASC